MKKIPVIILISILFLAGCGEDKEEVQKEESFQVVKVRTINTEDFDETYNIVGIVKPYEEATLSSEEGGLITYLSVDKGSNVRRGQTIARIKKDVEYASYEQSLSQYEFAKSEYDRLERLFEDNVVTEQQFTNAKFNLEIAEKTMEVARTRLSKSVVRSPISGVVDAKMMNRGEMSSPGAPIVNIVNISKVKISVGIPERYLNDVTKGTSVQITFDVFPDEVFDGVVSYVAPTISPINRTFEVEVVINNPDRRIKPEMSSNVSITRNRIPNAVVLPQNLIVDYGDEKYVFVLEGDIAKKRVISLGGRNGNNVLITKGLNPGEQFIYEGYQNLADGDKVNILK